VSHVLKPYPEYKDSGLPWLGEIPSHWRIQRGKTLFQCIDIRSTTGDEELLTVSSEYGIVPRRAVNVSMFKAESYIGHKLCWPGDLVINSLWAWARGLGVSQYHGIVSSAYGVYRLNSKFNEYAGYIHELVRSAPFQWELQLRSKGIWVSRLQLTDEAFLDAPFPIPQQDEIDVIVRFLSHIDQRIRRYIRAKQKLIKLLEEQKQGIIHRAVTRGLDPNVRLKISGVEWLGDIPEHWDVLPLRLLADVIDPNPSHRNPIYVDNGWPFISTVEFIGTDEIEFNTSRRVNEATVKEQEKRCRFQQGSIAFSRKGTIGAARILPEGVRFALLDSVCVINCISKVLDYRFLYRQISSGVITAQLGALMRGAALKQVSIGRVRETSILVPPINEQRNIIEILETAIPNHDRAIASVNHEISLLREYRARLISEVVSGKLDIREIELSRISDEAAKLANWGEGDVSEMEMMDTEEVLDEAD